jgi:hypothetical protein
MHTMDDAERRKVLDAAIAAVKDPARLEYAIENACAKLLSLHKSKEAEGITLSVFAHACDLCYTDLEVPDSEKLLLKRLEKYLEIDEEREAKPLLEAIWRKNRH